MQESTSTPLVCWLPVGFPDVDGLWVCDVVLQCLLVQQVEKVFDRQRHGATGAEDGREQIVHELLQRALSRRSRGPHHTSVTRTNLCRPGNVSLRTTWNYREATGVVSPTVLLCCQRQRLAFLWPTSTHIWPRLDGLVLGGPGLPSWRAAA